jgi:hypothetical protein
MTKTSVQRRRRWAISEKERIVAVALEPGAVAWKWREPPAFTSASCSDGALWR